MGYWDHVDVSEWLYTSEEEYEYQQQLDDELLAHEYAAQSEADYQAGRQLFLDNLPLGWCQNADQREGWLSMLPPEQRQQAIQDALAYEPVVISDLDELPF